MGWWTHIDFTALPAGGAGFGVVPQVADGLRPKRWPPIAEIPARAEAAAWIGFSDLEGGADWAWTGESTERAQRTASSAGSIPSTRLATSS